MPDTDTLEERIAAHLRVYPWLTAHEVSRALRRANIGAVPRVLARMEEAGAAECRKRPRTDGSPGTRTEWRMK